MIREHRRQIARLASCFKRVSEDSVDDFYRSELARLYCVELSGLLENMVRETVSGYCLAKSSPRVANYVASSIDRFQNPDAKKILSVVAAFDRELKVKLESFWDGEIKDAVSSIVGNRHLIAHGRGTNVSMARISEWYKSVVKLSDFLENEIFGD